MSAGSSSANNIDSTYVGSREMFPVFQNTTPDLLAITEDTKNIFKVFGKELAELTSLRAIFNHEDELNPEELMGGEATHTKKTLDNGKMSLLLTKPPSQYSPPLDALDDLDSPPTVSDKYASNATFLAKEGDLNRYLLTATDDKFFIVYQDWVHQNHGTHIDVRIGRMISVKKYGKI